MDTEYNGVNSTQQEHVMISSMTAFARVQVQEEWGSLIWEVRSVNHRYLEPKFRLPEQLREVESALRLSLKQSLKRGKIECYLKLQLSENTSSLTLNPFVLEQLHNAVSRIQQEFGDSAKVNALDILSWPGVQTTTEVDAKILHQAAIESFETALKQLNTMRAREGNELRLFIENRLNKIGAEVIKVREWLPTILEAQRKKIMERLFEAKQELNLDRLEQEMVILAQKMDVDEELDRLDTHIAEVRRTLQEQDNSAYGRRLDFLMQELNREANTLSSKSVHAGLTQTAVSMKVMIEQMREQVQNIE